MSDAGRESCLFAAKAGAKHVYGIDCSSIIEQARQIVSLNGFDNKITLIKGKVGIIMYRDWGSCGY